MMRLAEAWDTNEFAAKLALRGGRELFARLVQARDVAGLSAYFQGLSSRFRYNRFLGAVSELSQSDLDVMTHQGIHGRFAIVVVTCLHGEETIVGEARLAFDDAAHSCEFSLSVADQWHRCGIGSALLSYLECRAVQLGATSFLGDTLRANEEMLELARKSGFSLAPSPGDWKLVRFEKPLAGQCQFYSGGRVLREAQRMAAASA